MIIAPVTEIRPVPFERVEATPVFTSVNAISRVPQVGKHVTAWCVGARSAEAASSQGYRARHADGSADDLVAAILGAGDPGPFVHYRGEETRGDVAARLRDAGLYCNEVVVYAQGELPLTAEALDLLARPGPVLVPLFSPRSAERLAEAIAGHAIEAELSLVAMSDAVAAAWRGPGLSEMRISDNPTAVAMLDALCAASGLP